MEMIQSILAFIFWFQLVSGAFNVEWSLNQKLKTIENSLIYNKNFNKFLNITYNDNYVHNIDDTKVKRSYENARCIKDLQWIQQNINNAQNGWAFQLFDTWGTIPRDANVDYGNFEKCKKISPMTSQSLKIKSQYCSLIVQISHLRKLQSVCSYGQLGICIPDSCAPTLIKTIMMDYLNASKSVEMNIPAEWCQLQNDNTKFFFRDKLMVVFIVSVFLLVVSSTIFEVICDRNGEKKSSVLLAFSALSNGKELFSCGTNTSHNVFDFFHGIRVISCSWIIFGHIKDNYIASSNVSKFEEFVDTWFKHIYGGTHLSVDSFFTLTGILVSISILKRHSKSQMNFWRWCSLVFQRVWRVLPVMAFVALFQMTLFQFIADGPLYPEIDGQRSGCMKNMWKTMFFVSNYLGRDCLDVSWYTSTDMQLFILAPFLLFLMQRNEKRFVMISILLIAIDYFAIFKGWAIWNLGYEIYFTTHHHFASWLIGLNFGYFLHKYRDRKFVIPKYLNILAMIGSLIIMAMLVYYHHYVLPLYGWTFRIVWSLALCYIIFACAFGYGGVINWFLSMPVLHPLSRLSFTAFIIERMVITAVLQNGQQFSTIAYTFLLIVGLTNAVAVIVTLMVEMPIAKLKPRFYSRSEKPKDIITLVK